MGVNGLKLVVQRVSRASVVVDGRTVGEIERGLLILLGVAAGDGEAEARWCADKVAGLRIFPDQDGKMNLSLLDTGGEALVVSQFTLLGNVSKGKRPSFVGAAEPNRATELYERFVTLLRQSGVRVATGVFAAKMSVTLVNEGPVTIIVERNSGNSEDVS